MLAWDRILQEIGNDENFAIRYRNWTGNMWCDPAICSEELLGVTNQDDGTVKGKYFDNWYVICTREQNYFLTKMCDPTHKKPGLERITEKEKEEKVRKRDILWHFQLKKKLSLLWGLRLLTCHPMENSQAVILKTS